MRLIDLSQPVYDGCPNCPTHPQVSSQIIADHAADEWRMEHLHIASHTGSHIDAPLHKIAGGGHIGTIPLESFVGPAVVADLRGIAAETAIGEQHLEAALPSSLEDRIVLLATGWGDKRARTDEWFYHAPFLSTQGAEWLVAHKIRGIGIDHYSVGGAEEPRNGNTHTVLLGAGIWILEELHFPSEVFSLPQPLDFWALPVNFQEHSGAFCRPVVAAHNAQ